MKLFSCPGCGVVFDKDQLEFPTREYREGDYFWHEFFVKIDGVHIHKVDCPICGEPIPETQKTLELKGTEEEQ